MYQPLAAHSYSPPMPSPTRYPVKDQKSFRRTHREKVAQKGPVMVGLSGLEPLTPALSAQCSNRLSYRPPLDSQVTVTALLPSRHRNRLGTVTAKE